jgi:DOPA 4,5-dioxygenase
MPESDVSAVVKERVKEWHFHIYFLLQSPIEKAAALALRDAVLRLRLAGKHASPACNLLQDSLMGGVLGAFVAVPLWRVNEYPMGPHPAGSYEVSIPHTV